VKRARRAGRRGASDTGSVTAELALALPTLILVLAIGVWLQSAVALQARCLDAARAGARAAARGDPDGTIRARLAGALPAGATVRVGHSAGLVTVTVQAPATAPAGLSSLLAAPTVTGSATSADEASTAAPATP
jgi:Flp pilus assembly protein TadG